MSVKLKAELKLWFKWFTLPPNQRQQLLCITHSLSQIHFQHKHQAQHSSGNKHHPPMNGSVDQRQRMQKASTKQHGEIAEREKEFRHGMDQLDTDNSDIDFSPARGRHP
ncbi:hypothetical protein T10_2212 [Trichinella papuae]|uniref:Uncharacterized protein n=1 Tax=Trichinella papuae TaxID=268474 RepID=A0A0V1M448_9BILA|nr:hypothetical protein T10_2212 [Trichinella papuae]